MEKYKERDGESMICFRPRIAQIWILKLLYAINLSLTISQEN